MNRKRKVLEYLETRFGIPPEVFDTYTLLDEGDIWVTSPEVPHLPIRTYKRRGIRLARVFKDGKVKLTTAGIQLFGRFATRNVVDLTAEEAMAYAEGKDVRGEFPHLEPGQVIVRYRGHCLGSALYQPGRLKNQLPKGRRLQIQIPPQPDATALIFDLDGVILDSEPLHVEATNQVLRRYGHHLTLEENVPYMGLGEREYWNALIQKFGLPEGIEGDLARAKAEIYEQLLRTEPLVPIPGISEFLARCQQAGFLLAVASSSRHPEIRLILQRLDFLKYFRVVVSSQDVQQGKPRPDIFLKAAKALDVPPERCIVFEDSLNGIRAARAAGMKVVAVRAPKGADLADLTLKSFKGVSPEELVQHLL